MGVRLECPAEQGVESIMTIKEVRRDNTVNRVCAEITGKNNVLNTVPAQICDEQ